MHAAKARQRTGSTGMTPVSDVAACLELMMTAVAEKPLNAKAYGHIPHLHGSRMGRPSDHKVHDGQHGICTKRLRDKHDLVIVEEKLDGSCVSVAMLDGVLVPLIRAGYRAVDSKYEQHRMFDAWVWMNEARFKDSLREGERIVGEWIAQAHGTRYDCSSREPFFAFDLMVGTKRATRDKFWERLRGRFCLPTALHYGGPCSIEKAMLEVRAATIGFAIDEPEGAVWRVERKGAVDFLAKFVRPDKVDGHYLPEISGQTPVWNWKP